MPVTASSIDRIVDYTAWIAASVEGVKMVFGTGQGQTDDPLRPGHKIQTAPVNPAAPFAHWSDVPDAPSVEWVSQDGTVELTWRIPMRLWLPKTDEEARRVAMPFYDRYLRAFARDPFFGERPYNLAKTSNIAHFHIGGDKDWSWLDVGLLVVERVNYAS